MSEPTEGRPAASADKTPAAPSVAVERTDARPDRPLYGEYATPEEQRARIRQPDATWALENGQAVVPESPGPSRPAASAPEKSPLVSAAQPAKRRGGLADRVITIALLGYGLFAVLSSFVALTDFPTFANMWMETVGIDGEFTNFAQGRLWGTIAAAVFAIGWLITAVLSWRMLRRGRITFWVPIVGAVVSYLAVTALLLVPLLGDPAIAEYLTRVGS
ncbi:DUF6264 family protein [Micromonospora sp. DT81.3]|uniref:DUF6264 family protein n=1 Tax=Micromonospora sp. DT81.3 TaxID=3416523 RepID=UPI003CEDF568